MQQQLVLATSRLALAVVLLALALVCGTRASPLSSSPSAERLSEAILDGETGDVFELLSEDELQREWSFEDDVSLQSRRRHLAAFDEVVYVVIKLVGFDGDSNMQLHMSARNLTHYLDALLPSDWVHVIKPMPPGGIGSVFNDDEDGDDKYRDAFDEKNSNSSSSDDSASDSDDTDTDSTDDTSSTSPSNRRIGKAADEVGADGAIGSSPRHATLVRRQYMYEVVQAPPDLVHAIGNVTTRRTSAADDGTYTGIAIDASEVDTLIRSDFWSGDQRAYTLYIINAPETPTPYWYTKGSPDPKTNPCGFSVWAGKDRYAWLDLSAGPVTYGPHTKGDGPVNAHCLPHRSHYRLDPTPGDKARKHVTALPLDLVGFVRRTLEYLISPPMDRFPVPPRPRITLHLVVMHDHGVHEHNRHGFFSWAAVQQELRSLPRFDGHVIRFRTTEFSLRDCRHCAALYAAAQREHTSQVLDTDLRSTVHPFLDAAELHDWLGRYRDRLVPPPPPPDDDDDDDDDDEFVFPVFLFDLASPDVLLLDRFHQAVAFDDMVVGVQTRAPRMPIDASCSQRQVSVDPRDCTRAVLGAVLRAVWGVAPTHRAWSAAKGMPTESHVWSVGDTPYGPLSRSRELSFAQREATVRHVLYTTATETLWHAGRLFDRVAEVERTLDDLLRDHYQDFVRRWNVFQWKLDEARTWLSLQEYNSCLRMLRAARHDVRAMHRLVVEAGAAVQTVLQCREPPPTSLYWNGALAASAVAVGLCAHWTIRPMRAFQRWRRRRRRRVKAQ